VTVPLPDASGRAAILGVHLRDVELDEASAGSKEDVARQLAALTPGFSGEGVVCGVVWCVRGVVGLSTHGRQPRHPNKAAWRADIKLPGPRTHPLTQVLSWPTL
jgi:hypothetical protein